MAVRIESGISDWQIIQQKDGFGKLVLEGSYNNGSGMKRVEVYVRIVHEDTAETIVFWKKAESNQQSCTWNISIESIPVGGLYRVETCLKGKEQIGYEWAEHGDMIHHIGVGDLFVIAGQSNSAGYGKDPVYDPPEIGVHIYKNRNQWDLASHPLNDSTGAIQSVNTEGANSGHSPYLAFAKYLKRNLNYPIGLIQTALGGSLLSQWNPDESGELYQNMIHKILQLGGEIKGILWYQGCSDACPELSDTYEARFLHMVNRLREEVAKPDLPIFTMQLNRNISIEDQIHDESWSRIREIQRSVSRTIQNVYVIPTIDGMMSDCIHNGAAFNMILGERMAKQVLTKVYGRELLCDAPDLESMVLQDTTHVIMKFAPVYDYLYLYGVECEKLPFTIIDENGIIGIDSYELVGKDTLCLVLEREVQGKCTGYNYYGQNPQGTPVVDFATHYPILGFVKNIEKK